jgi:CubicO group peptidase (beta-lactamase class C family)
VRSDPLPRSAPAAEGVSAAGIAAFLDAAEADPGIGLHSLMVLRHGRVIAEGWWAPHRPTDARQLYSVSKSFTASALGLAVAEDRLALSDKVVDHFPNQASVAGPRMRTVTVEHLARMATGHHSDTLEAMRQGDRAEPVHGFLRLEPESPPGSVFAYNNGASYTLAAILQARTGQSLTGYLQPRLFDPLGIAPPFWDTMGGPREIGFAGLHLTTEDVARFGQLYAQGGQWHGQTVLPRDFVATATRALTANPGEPMPDWQQGYGYQFWQSRHGYRADGAFGQFCLVLPEQDAVVVITSETEIMQPLLDAVWEHLLPAFGGSGGSDDELAGRLATSTLPVEGGGTYGADDWVTARAVAPTATGSGWSLTLADADRTLVIDCGDGRWQRTAVPTGADRVLLVEAQGRWPDPDTFVAELVLVQCPHRLTVTLHPSTGKSVARWRTVPLRAPSLVELATPLPT